MTNEKAIKRLENNHYAINKSVKRLEQAIEERDEMELYTTIGESLLWVLATDEWHKKHSPGYCDRKKQHEKGKILFGLLHAYNSIKHNMDIIQIHKRQGGFSFPIRFPVSFPEITVRWIEAGDQLNGKYPSQKRNYIRYIEGKEVLLTISIAIEFLQEEYTRIVPV